jgi:hypothetical protein
MVISILALTGLLAAAPAADAVELGVPSTPEEASCPENCQAVGQVSGYQLRIGDMVNPLRASGRGKITAFTVTLGTPTDKQRSFFTTTFGGEPKARISVLRRGAGRRHRLTGQSPVFDLAPHLGSTHTFTLERPLTVKEGYVVALTVPTWAPAFAVGRSREEGWRSSRDFRRCADVRQQAAQQRRGSLRTYGCFYRTSRLLYTVTFEPVAPAEPPPPAS